MAKDGKLLYHLTALDNMASIFQNGLQPRAALKTGEFQDVADEEILDGRHEHDLEQYVPFHFYAKNPFDYGVQRSRSDEDFVLVTVRRSAAQTNNWKIIPRHPLAEEGYEILDYDDGFDEVDWRLIAEKDYEVRACKVACMAECLSPGSVPADKIFAVYVKTEAAEKAVRELAERHGASCYINLMPIMFVGNANV